MTEQSTFSRRIELGLTKPDGTLHRIAASEAERAALAQAYGLLELRRLEAEATISAGMAAGSIVVEGRVTAELTQACVVTLEPVEQAIDEVFSRRFVRPGTPGRRSRNAPAPRSTSIRRPTTRRSSSTDHIDLGTIAQEHFVLAIDPYPRAPGAALPPEVGEPAEVKADSPFAALAALQHNDPEGN